MTFKEFKYLMLIITVFIAACMETDIYLPAFPDMMVFFHTSEEAIQSLLTWNFAGICLAGPFYGPVSDSYGRKKPLLIALTVFFIGSIFTIYANDFDTMLAGRVLQGLGSGGCFTLGGAIIFDAFQKEKAIRAMTQINTIIPFIMATAPMIGAWLNIAYGFHSNFIFIAVFVLVSLLITLFFFGETHPEEKRVPFDVNRIAKEFKIVLTCKRFWGLCVAISLFFGGFLAFLSNSAVLFVLRFGVTKELYPFYQMAILVAFVIGSQTCSPAIKKYGIPSVKKWSLWISTVGALAFLIFGLLFPEEPMVHVSCMCIYTIGVNWNVAIYFPELMDIHPEIKGVTSGLMNSIRLILTAAVIVFSSKLYNGTTYPIIAVMTAIMVVSLPLVYMYEKRAKEFSQQNESEA